MAIGHELAEVFGARQGDGEDAVDEVKRFVVWILWVTGLDADVEEADAVLELLFWRHGLTTH